MKGKSSSGGLRAAMLLLLVTIGICWASVAQAYEYRRLSANISWVRWEWSGSDWNLSFRIPDGWKLAWVEKTTDRSYNLWGYLLYYNGYRTSNVWVDITAGYRARTLSRAGYRSIDEWKNEIYVWVYR